MSIEFQSVSSDVKDTSVVIVIVNFRTPHDTCKALESLVAEAAGVPKVRVIVTDNQSGDDSTEIISGAIQSNQWSDWVQLMPLQRNGGFAYGNNEAIRVALRNDNRPDYIMLLNPDTIVEPHAIKRLVEFLNANQDYGIAGANVFLANGSPQVAARRLPQPISEFEEQIRTGVFSRLLQNYRVTLSIHPEQPTDCEWVSGAAMMIRSSLFEQIGLIDEGYFLYFEEVDFCARAKKIGCKVAVVPDSRIIHLEGASTQISNTKKRRGKYWYESRRRYFVKHFGLLGLLRADFCWSLGRTLGKLIDLLRVKSSYQSDPARFTSDLLLGDLKAILCGFAARTATGKDSRSELSSPSQFTDIE
ncbi:MAG: glycosyltransferase family 2 protein [Planctomycetales bacterium]|nr:glycosyltransferase family 2 protein [Planctomycetales bacterium]